MTDERDPDVMDPPVEVQGYMCVSTDLSRAGTVKGGQTFITKDELKMSLQDQHQAEDLRKNG